VHAGPSRFGSGIVVVACAAGLAGAASACSRFDGVDPPADGGAELGEGAAERPPPLPPPADGGTGVLPDAATPRACTPSQGLVVCADFEGESVGASTLSPVIELGELKPSQAFSRSPSHSMEAVANGSDGGLTTRALLAGSVAPPRSDLRVEVAIRVETLPTTNLRFLVLRCTGGELALLIRQNSGTVAVRTFVTGAADAKDTTIVITPHVFRQIALRVEPGKVSVDGQTVAGVADMGPVESVSFGASPIESRAARIWIDDLLIRE